MHVTKELFPTRVRLLLAHWRFHTELWLEPVQKDIRKIGYFATLTQRLSPFLGKACPYSWLRANAVQLRQQCPAHMPLDECVDTLIAHRMFLANQKRNEILPLLQQLRALRPRYLCEIGSAQGGTLFLFSQVAASNAALLSIDIGFSKAQLRAYPHLGRPGQSLRCMSADSHKKRTRKAIEQWLGGNRLDFLFIDGDHSLAGVTEDYKMYAPLVRPGGLIAFHDIVPDHSHRFGVNTGSDAGEVPAFWSALKEQHQSAREFIEDSQQDGYGLGVISMPE